MRITCDKVSDLQAISDLRLAYDPRVLSLPDASRITAGRLLRDFLPAVKVDNQIGLVRISAAGSKTANGAGLLFEIQFDRVTKTKGASTTINLVSARLEDSQGLPMRALLVDAKVTLR